MDPRRQARLRLEDDRLVCERCGLTFRIKDGLPNMVVEEAELPAGCTGLEHLPSRHAPPSGENG
jgi:hypothetical protein